MKSEIETKLNIVMENLDILQNKCQKLSNYDIRTLEYCKDMLYRTIIDDKNF